MGSYICVYRQTFVLRFFDIHLCLFWKQSKHLKEMVIFQIEIHFYFTIQMPSPRAVRLIVLVLS